jgi:threonine dehydrogenase-like Zn-dependent dehydrogenase
MSPDHASERRRYADADASSSTNLGWNFYGVGVQSMGRNGGPEPIDIPSLGPDQLLVRVDAVGLCYSDVKLINQGGAHPKLYGRDLATEPTRLGHEATVTVIDVGVNLDKKYHPGQRLAIQPDIYVDKRSTAYGYTIPGGLIQTHLLGPEVLDADDGAYVIDVDDSIGYAAAALSEPWACVEAAYTQRRRLSPLRGGIMWMIGHADDPVEYAFSSGLNAPGRVVLTDVSPHVADMVAAHIRADAITVRDGIEPDGYAALAEELTNGAGFDDIVLLDPWSSAQMTSVAAQIGFRGTVNLVGRRRLDGPSSIDVGRIHYDYTAYLGNQGPDIGASYGAARNRAELRPGGVAVYVGAGGPMGQMHIQRALELATGPQTIIATDLNTARLQVVRDVLIPLANERGRNLVVVDAGEDPEAPARAVAEATGGVGADDVIVSVPVAAVMGDAARLMGPDGMLVLFAGVPNGSMTLLDVSNVYLHNAQLTGTSGSRISDQEVVLAKAVAGELSPERSLAAVGGIEAAQDGVQAMLDGRFAGKIVIFPQLRGLDLMGIDELAERYPTIGQKLDRGRWTVAAEAEMIATFWPSQ